MDFNKFAKDYSYQIERAVPYAGASHRAFLAEKALQLKTLAQCHFGILEQLRVLDVGCGIGLMEQDLKGQFLRLVGVDVADQALEVARQTLPEIEFIRSGETTLPFDDCVFDIAFAVCVFHHVPPEHRQGLIREMARVTSKGGLVVIFEHNPLNPVTRLIVWRCELDRDARLIGCGETLRLLSNEGLDQITSKQILYFPWRGRFWISLESLIASWCPLGTQYYVAGKKAA